MSPQIVVSPPGEAGQAPPVLPTVSSEYFRKSPPSFPSPTYIIFASRLGIPPYRIRPEDFVPKKVTPTDKSSPQSPKAKVDRKPISGDTGSIASRQSPKEKVDKTPLSEETDSTPSHQSPKVKFDTNQGSNQIDITPSCSLKITIVMPKPKFEHVETNFASLKNIKEKARLKDAQFSSLCEAARNFVEDNMEKCKTPPRQYKKPLWKEITDTFIRTDNIGEKYWSEDRDGCDPAEDLVWPEDKDDITFLIFAVLRWYSSNTLNAKRKSDADSPGSSKSKTPKKTPGSDAPSSAGKDGSDEGDETPKSANSVKKKPAPKQKGETSAKKKTTKKTPPSVKAQNKGEDKKSDQDGAGDTSDEEDITGETIQGKNIHTGDPFGPARVSNKDEPGTSVQRALSADVGCIGGGNDATMPASSSLSFAGIQPVVSTKPTDMSLNDGTVAPKDLIRRDDTIESCEDGYGVGIPPELVNPSPYQPGDKIETIDQTGSFSFNNGSTDLQIQTTRPAGVTYDGRETTPLSSSVTSRPDVSMSGPSTIVIDVSVASRPSDPSPSVAISSNASFAHFYGMTVLGIKESDARAALAEASDCVMRLPGGHGDKTFGIRDTAVEAVWKGLMKMAISIVGPGGPEEGAMLRVEFE